MAQRRTGPGQKTGSGNPAGGAAAANGANEAADDAAGGAGAARKIPTGSTSKRPAGATAVKAGGAKTASGRGPSGPKGPGGPGGRGPNGPGGRGSGGAGGRQPPRKPGKSIVNQKQTPWGLVAATVAVVLFAAAIVVVVIATHKSGGDGSATTATKGGQSVDANDPYRQPELPAAKAIKGVTYRVEGNHTHVDGHIKYDSSPPVGGNHSQYWADCTGTVYPKAIANENAVHMLEHGAVWVTYNAKTLSAAGVAKLKTYVSGQDRMAMSPYPNLKTPISLQSWGYQLFVDSASDPRIPQFISTLRYNSKTTPEPSATCSQPTFKTHPSTYGNPLWQPSDGASGNTSGQ
ncbi:DUF3105 domain-containing protein [uncultured Jatrophihabitans sp.]|uniref:DUF3105 domain-containing protein n=1 Tax=uncultured Jatrophihabitans sp. TaxID=1610747 RepID=UPI0035CB8E56